MFMNHYALSDRYNTLMFQEVYEAFQQKHGWEEDAFDIVKCSFLDGSFYFALDPPTELSEQQVREAVEIVDIHFFEQAEPA